MRSDKVNGVIYEDWFEQQLVELGIIVPVKKEVEEELDEHNTDPGVS